jgi:hypothetical protein
MVNVHIINIVNLLALKYCKTQFQLSCGIKSMKITNYTYYHNILEPRLRWPFGFSRNPL